MDSDEQAFVWTCIFISLVHVPGHGIAGSDGHSLGNRQAVAVSSGCIVVHPHQPCPWTPVSLVYCNHTARCAVVSHVLACISLMVMVWSVFPWGCVFSVQSVSKWEPGPLCLTALSLICPPNTLLPRLLRRVILSSTTLSSYTEQTSNHSSVSQGFPGGPQPMPFPGAA